MIEYWSCRASLVIAAVYVIISIFTWNGTIVLISYGLVLFGLACIWYGDDIGQYTDFGGGTPAITKSTPGVFIVVFGWVVLVSPIAAFIWRTLRDKFL